MKKLIALLLAATFALGTLAGCGGDKKEEGSATSANAPETVTWNLQAEPKTLDPTLNQAVDSGQVISHTFEGLYAERKDGLVPGVAKDHTVTVNEDGTATYVFNLREDAKWSDGKPVTANDFVFSWRRAVTPATAASYSYIMAPIVNATEITAGQKDPSELGVKAVDDHTLEVTLVKETPFFLELTAFPTFMPLREDVVDPDGVWARDPKTAIGNGAYNLTNYVMGDHLELTKSDTYWNKDIITVQNLVGKMIGESSTILAAFREGTLDISEGAPTGEIPQLLASGELQILPYLGCYFYVINTTTDNEALQNPLVRKAINLAIDRKAICENVVRGGQAPATGFVAPGIKDSEGRDFRETAGNYYLTETANVEEAKKLLAEAGYPNGEGIGEITISYNTADNHKMIAEAVMEMLKQIGITVKLDNQEWQVFQATRNNLEYPAIARHGWIGDYHEAQTFLDMYTSGNINGANGYSNPEYDKLIEKALASSGKERDDAFYAAEEMLVNDAYIIPIYFYTTPLLVSDKIDNWHFSELGKIWLGEVTYANN